ncbi:hypothetical protein BS50DRAFT_632377 [Corynespora cassiicola Philippines]|uniref:FAD-binding domain-containing protein n=1 Tax=Corynespora cassiicola Philippines TaxID=1448308 RepID=A0A2T2NYL4_CORCC|nr:hypothetical protein BS50DRAFT_632377 [Corynespora cassiicola Philippines]
MAKDTIIIGGSITGLMCGIMLKHHGYNVTIIEQEASTFRPGYNAGMSLRGEAGAFLEAHDRVGRDMVIEGTSGENRPAPQRGITLRNTSWGLLVRVLRANFDGVMSKAVPVAPATRKGSGKTMFKNGVRGVNLQEAGQKVTVERTLLSDVNRDYLGYFCWRGTVPEELVDEKWNKVYLGKTMFEFLDQSYLIIYTIPTDEGDFSPRKRLHNWVWYPKMTESPEMNDLFTDVNGLENCGTVPRNLVRPEA